MGKGGGGFLFALSSLSRSLEQAVGTGYSSCKSISSQIEEIASRKYHDWKWLYWSLALKFKRKWFFNATVVLSSKPHVLNKRLKTLST